MNKLILNIGAGNRIIEGADNHDIIKHRPEINLAFDLNKRLDEFYDESGIKDYACNWSDEISHQLQLDANNYYDEIQFISVIEHLIITPVQALNECWHLLKPDGKLIVKYPHFTSFTAYRDPTHRWFIDEYALEVVDPNTQLGTEKNYYTPYKWKILTLPQNRLIIKGGNRINVKMEMTPLK